VNSQASWNSAVDFDVMCGAEIGMIDQLARDLQKAFPACEALFQGTIDGALYLAPHPSIALKYL
jgi:hypothetical protein